MGRKVIAFWLSIVIVFGFIVIVDVTMDFTLNVGGTTLYVNTTGSDGAYTSIQDAINAANNGDTVFVYNGSYIENVVVNKAVNLIGEDRNITIINGSWNEDVMKIETDWVNVTGFTIINSGNTGGPSYNSGIKLYFAYNCGIFNNTLDNNRYGIFSWNSDENDITYNKLTNNSWGIYYHLSDDNLISFNNILDNVYGIYLDGSRCNNITANKMIGNGIFINGGTIGDWNTHNIDTSNTVNGKPVYYWSNKTGSIVPLGAGQIILANCQNVSVESYELTNTSVGIEVGFSSNISITGNIIFGNEYGIYLFLSNGNSITDNNISSNNMYGIFLFRSDRNNLIFNNLSENFVAIFTISSDYNNLISNNATMNFNGLKIQSSDGNNITDNIASDNGIGLYLLSFSSGNNISNNNILENGVGMRLDSSIGNNITNNNASISGKYSMRGFFLFNSHGNNFNGNNASYNTYGFYIKNSGSNNITSSTTMYNSLFGIYLDSSHWNNITNNTILQVKDYGIYLNHSSNNSIYHNNIVENIKQAFDDQNDNSWDNGYPIGGNYWSDYIGNDSFKGPYQDIPGSDCIGDMNYSIDSDSVDNYPLMEPYTYKPLENHIILKQGWNLISIPLIQEEQNLTKVLGSIDSWYDAVQWHDITDKIDPWKHHKVGKPLGNDLSELNEEMGFWIHITQPGDTIFLYNGTQPTSNQTIPLHPGWNMVGYPSLTSYNRTQGLNNITFGTDVDAIWSYDAATQKWETMDESDSFFLGKGYWIHSKVTKVWDVPL